MTTFLYMKIILLQKFISCIEFTSFFSVTNLDCILLRKKITAEKARDPVVYERHQLFVLLKTVFSSRTLMFALQGTACIFLVFTLNMQKDLFLEFFMFFYALFSNLRD